MEKNPTIVNFPVKGIEFGDLLTDEVSQNQFIGSELFLFGSDQLLLNNAGQGQGLILIVIGIFLLTKTGRGKN